MIKIKNITKKYDNNLILEQASYEFPQKGLVCLMGASGSGKTTLLNLLAGFDSQYEGEITLGSTSISQMNADSLCKYRRDNIGFVFQDYHLLVGYTALENVMLALELTGENQELGRKKAAALLERLGIPDKVNQKTENLSGGQKQRVAIARALINNPQILFADEPTGALDRTTSTEIMTLLKEISKDRLVVVITHDQKICDFAEEVIHIKDRQIEKEGKYLRTDGEERHLVVNIGPKGSSLGHASKNFKVHMKRYIAVSLAISIGILAFLFSLSFGNVMEQSIRDFKTKNTAFNNGYIKGVDDGTVQNFLTADNRIENVYYQYKINHINLTLEGKTETMPEKYPTPKATEELSYGIIPRKGMNEIALSPSLAKKYTANIKTLIGKEITLEYDGQIHKLFISGIFNAGYDDFFVSSDVEQQLYKNMGGQDNYSISYDVKEFSDIVAASNSLKLHGINSENASSEVYALQSTFNSLNRLFFIISVLVLVIGVFICVVLLVKLQNSRYREVGLLSALGFSKRRITSMIIMENIMLSILATLISFALLGGEVILTKILSFPFSVTGLQIFLCTGGIFILVMMISGMASYKLIRTEPAEALRK